APQRDEDGAPSISSAVNSWCGGIDGDIVKPPPGGVDVTFRMLPYSYYTYWLSAGFRYNSPSENDCGTEVKIPKDECESMIRAAMAKCDPNSGVSHGFSVNGKCVQYNVTMDSGLNPNSPPRNPLPKANDPICDMKFSSRVLRPFFSGLYGEFCYRINAGNKTLPAGSQLTNADFQAPLSKRFGNIKTPPVNAKQCEGWNFQFGWTGSVGDCRLDCAQAYESIVNSTGANTGGESNAMAVTGSVNAGCGVYSYSIEAPP
ncbi:hypothetical protein BJ875DRAFT_342240, partial [Amylocarpus encephaloides]